MVFSKRSIPVVILFSMIQRTVAIEFVDDKVLKDNVLELTSVKEYAVKLDNEIQQLKEDGRKNRLLKDYLESQLKLLLQSVSHDSNSHVREKASEQRRPVNNKVLQTIRKSKNLNKSLL